MTNLTGTQSITRTIGLLRLIARSAKRSASLSELASVSALPAPTVRRLLLCLIGEGMVSQDATTRRYHLGPLVTELGLCTHHHRVWARKCQPILEQVAHQSGDTVYLSLWSSYDSVCIGQVAPDGPVRVTTSHVGDRYPLGVTPGGVALLATLSTDDVEAILAEVANELPSFFGFTAEKLRAEIAETRLRGYAFSRERVTPGVSGLGVAIPRQGAQPLLSLAVGTITTRFEGGRSEQLAAMLHDAAAAIADLQLDQDNGRTV